jgi:hypothetical protein
MIGEFCRPLHLRAFRQHSGHLELRRDPVSGRGVWFAYGPAGSFLGSHSTRQRAAHARAAHEGKVRSNANIWSAVPAKAVVPRRSMVTAPKGQ